jgi:hypothetical protein
MNLAGRRLVALEESMKRTTLLLFVLLCTAPVFAQNGFQPTNVWFPHIDVGGDPNGLHYVTLVQAANNTSSFSIGHLVVYSDTGTAQSVSFDGQAPATSLDFSLDSGATRQIQVSLGSTTITPGWLQITYTPAVAETNVVLQYLSGASVLTEVGIPAFFGQMSATYFPVETNTAAILNTGIAIVNPNGPSVVLAELTDPGTGNLLASTTLSLGTNGHTSKLLTDLFPTATGINATTAVLFLQSCTTTACTAAGPGFIATALRLNGSAFTTLPVTQAASTGNLTRVLPHIAFGGSPSGVNFKTILYLTTFSGFTTSGTPGSTIPVTGQASMFDDSGNPISASANGGAAAPSFTFNVLANKVLKVVLSGSNTLQAGWIELNLPSTSTPLVVNAVFQTYQGSTIVSEASVLEAAQDVEGMLYVNVQPNASGSGYITNDGVALANPLSVSNSVTMTLYNSAGFVFATQTFTLAPFGHLAQYVTDMFPQLAKTSFSGTLSMQSGSNFAAVALRQNGSAGGGLGFAALPVEDDVMFLPSIVSLQVTTTNRSTGLVNFTISVADFSNSLVTPTAAGVFTEAAIVFANTSVQTDDYQFYLDGSSMINAATGTLSGTFQSAHTNIPSGTAATFEIYITDFLGNYSNVITLPFKF